jgi:hypothetical protein
VGGWTRNPDLDKDGLHAWVNHTGCVYLQPVYANRIEQLEAHVRRAIACIEQLTPYVMWDGLDGEDEQAKVEVTLSLLREAVKQ